MPALAVSLAAASALLVAVTPLPGAAQAPAQSAIRSVRLVTDVSPDRTDVQVRIEYTVSRPGATASPLRLEVLGFGPASVDTVRVEPAGRARGGTGATADPGVTARTGAIALTDEAGSMRVAELSLPAAPAGADATTLSLVYRVRGAVERSGADVRVRVPVLVVDLPPEPGGGPVFHGSVRVPEGWSVSGGFPTALAATPDGSWTVDLAVVPALVSLRGRSDGAWRPGLPEALDAVALIVLLVFGLVGWRHLREVARVGASASPGTTSPPAGRHPSGGPEARP